MSEHEQLPRYRCHKEVRAAKIALIEFDESTRHAGDYLPGDALLRLEDPALEPIRVTEEWLAKHEPTRGGYFVVYDGGYTSYSPAKPFEAGYRKV